MKTNRALSASLYLALLGLAGLLGCDLYDQEQPVLDPDQSGASRSVQGEKTSFALVELYTSEGCSSCPPAEALLNEISAEAREQDRRVYTLAFHVDTWDDLGWKDPWSDSRHTQRQKRYARRFGLRSMYTPQMIVNGREELVGHRRGAARDAIREALERPATASVTLRCARGPKRTLELEVDVRGAPEGSRTYVALAERNLETRVPRGENEGRLLRHDNVVRAMAAVVLDTDGRATLQLAVPADVERENASLVAWVQHPRTLETLGASALDALP